MFFSHSVFLVVVSLLCNFCFCDRNDSDYTLYDGEEDLFILLGFVSLSAFALCVCFTCFLVICTSADFYTNCCRIKCCGKTNTQRNKANSDWVAKRLFGFLSLIRPFKANLRFLFAWHFSTGLFSALLLIENWLSVYDSKSLNNEATCRWMGFFEEIFLTQQLFFSVGYFFFHDTFSVIKATIRIVSSKFKKGADSSREEQMNEKREERDSNHQNDENMKSSMDNQLQASGNIPDNLVYALSVNQRSPTNPSSSSSSSTKKSVGYDIYCGVYTFCEVSCCATIVCVAVVMGIITISVGVIHPNNDRWCWVDGFGYQFIFFYGGMVICGILFFLCSLGKIAVSIYRNRVKPSVVYPAIYTFLYFLFWYYPLFNRILSTINPKRHDILSAAQDLCMGLYSGVNVTTSMILMLIESYYVVITNKPKYQKDETKVRDIKFDRSSSVRLLAEDDGQLTDDGQSTDGQLTDDDSGYPFINDDDDLPSNNNNNGGGVNVISLLGDDDDDEDDKEEEEEDKPLLKEEIGRLT